MLLAKPATRPQASVPARMASLASPATAVPLASSRAALQWHPALVSDAALLRPPQPRSTQLPAAAYLGPADPPAPLNCPLSPADSLGSLQRKAFISSSPQRPLSLDPLRRAALWSPRVSGGSRGGMSLAGGGYGFQEGRRRGWEKEVQIGANLLLRPPPRLQLALQTCPWQLPHQLEEVLQEGLR